MHDENEWVHDLKVICGHCSGFSLVNFVDFHSMETNGNLFAAIISLIIEHFIGYPILSIVPIAVSDGTEAMHIKREREKKNPYSKYMERSRCFVKIKDKSDLSCGTTFSILLDQ